MKLWFKLVAPASHHFERSLPWIWGEVTERSIWVFYTSLFSLFLVFFHFFFFFYIVLLSLLVYISYHVHFLKSLATTAWNQLGTNFTNLWNGKKTNSSIVLVLLSWNYYWPELDLFAYRCIFIFVIFFITTVLKFLSVNFVGACVFLKCLVLVCDSRLQSFSFFFSVFGDFETCFRSNTKLSSSKEPCGLTLNSFHHWYSTLFVYASVVFTCQCGATVIAKQIHWSWSFFTIQNQCQF